MIPDKPTFAKGAALMISFIVVFVLIFMPLFDNGKNGLEFLDDLYNSISKGSAYYIPNLQTEVEPLAGKNVSLTLKMESPAQAEQTAKMMEISGALASVSGEVIKIEADLGQLLDSWLFDADLMYLNDGEGVKNKYGIDERQVLYNWWTAAKMMDRDLKRQKLFKEAMIVTTVEKKGMETSYNYYKIEPQKISDKWVIVLFSLVFYVIYTIWYGFAIMFLFEGWGLRLKH
jgi:hypothetical protein